MTIELAVVFPVAIVVAAIAVNALVFISECAAFDRAFPQTVRLYAVPAYGYSTEGNSGEVQNDLSSQFDKSYQSVAISVSRVDAVHVRFVGELSFSPTLFGMGVRDEVFGVHLPRIVHRSEYVVNLYKPGVIA